MTVSSACGARLRCSYTASKPKRYTEPGGGGGGPREEEARSGPGWAEGSASTRRLRMAVAGRQTLTSEDGCWRTSTMPMGGTGYSAQLEEGTPRSGRLLGTDSAARPSTGPRHVACPDPSQPSFTDLLPDRNHSPRLPLCASRPRPCKIYVARLASGGRRTRAPSRPA